MRFLLSGGIGSQLFQITAARWLAKRNNQRLLFDPSWLQVTRHKENFALVDTLELLEGESFTRRRPFANAAFEILASERFANNRWGLSRKSGVFLHSGDLDLLAAVDELLVLSGNFGNAKAHRELKSLGQQIRLKSYSSNGLVLKTEFTAIHIRGGDSIQLATTFGVLGAKYYSEALSLVPKDIPIVLVTDDVGHAMGILDSVKVNPRLIVSSDRYSPIQSLEILSSASFVIAANSSFSWWGAELSNKNVTKIGPSDARPNIRGNWMLDAEWLVADASWQFGVR